jgi:tetratricopeptide (TPR) repeat protein
VALSRCYRELGDLDRAIEVGEQLWLQVNPSENVVPVGLEDVVVVGATLLGAYIELGDKKRSNELAADLLSLAETADTPKAAGAAYWNASLAALVDGRTAEALRLAEKAQARMALTQDVRNKARLQTTIAGLHLRMEPPDPARAVQLLKAADAVLDQFGSKVDIGYCHTELARAHLLMHDYERAREVARGTLADLQDLADHPIEAARTLMVLAAAETALQQQDSALDAISRAAKILESAGATRQAASSWAELAEICVNLGQSEQAIEAYRKATQLLGTRRTAGAPYPDETTPARPTEAEAS